MENFTIDFSNSNVDKSLPTLSISAMLGLISQPFDSKGVAQKTHDKHFNNPDSQYYQMSVEDIMEAWSAKGAESCRYGSLLDDYIGLNLADKSSIDYDSNIELYKLDNNYDYDERLHGLCDSFDNFKSVFLNNGDWEFIDRERTVYYKWVNPVDPTDIVMLKGRFDALFRNTKTSKWMIVDWKSSGDIEKANRWSKLLGPCMKLDACNWNTYTLQVHFYKKTFIEMGYLPEGSTENDIDVMIVHMPGKIIESVGTNFQTCREAFPYNSSFMDQLFSFAIRKNKLINK